MGIKVFLTILLDDRRIRIRTSDLRIRIRILEAQKHTNPYTGYNVTKMFTFTEQNEIWEVTNDDLFCDLPSLMDLHLGKPPLSLKFLVW